MDFFDHLADSWADKAVAGGYITQEDRPIHRYGFRLGLAALAISLSVFVISFLLRCTVPTLFFILFYCLLRSFAGGIHAASHKMCYFVSIGMYLLIYLASLVDSISVPIGVGLFVLAAIILWILAPVEDPNKPLSKSEIMSYRRFSRSLLVLEAIAMAIMVSLSVNRQTILFACYGVVAIAVLVLLGIVKNRNLAKRTQA